MHNRDLSHTVNLHERSQTVSSYVKFQRAKSNALKN